MPIKNFFSRAFFLQRIDRYLITEIAVPFVGGSVFFVFIFLMFQILRLAEFFIVHGVSIFILGKILSYLSLTLFSVSLPMALLIGVLNAYSRLSADSELVALKASGVSLLRLSRWPLFLSIIISLVSLYANMETIPGAEKAINANLVKVGNTKVVSSIKEGTFTAGFFDLLVYADKTDPKTNRMQRVFIFDERQAKTPMTIIAERGEITPIQSDSDLGASIVFHLEKGNIHRNDFETETYQKINFDDYRLFLKVTEGIDDSGVQPKMLNTHELRDRLTNPNTPPLAFKEGEVEFWRRIQLAFLPIPFVLLGIGFGTVRTRSVRAGSTFIAFLILLAYWIMLTAAISFALKGWLPTGFSLFIPFFVLIAFGIHHFRKSSW